MITIRIKTNFYLSGKKIISYSTHVGNIEDKSITVFGKYSRTTSKHLYSLASHLGLPINLLTEEKLISYWNLYQAGVGEVGKDLPGLLGNRSSEAIYSAMRGQPNQELAILQTDPSKIKKEDREAIIQSFREKGKDLNMYEWSRFAASFENFQRIKEVF